MRLKHLAWALATVLACLPAAALAQELKRDASWNGVVIGAAIGGGLAVVVAKKGDDICSVKDCALLLGLAGGALGHLVDHAIGAPAPVVPGQWIDDSTGNGALIGGGVGAAGLLVDLARHCGKGPGRVQCTTGASLGDLWKAALFSAAIGAVVDAAIPTRAPEAGSPPATSRRVSVVFSTRF